MSLLRDKRRIAVVALACAGALLAGGAAKSIAEESPSPKQGYTKPGPATPADASGPSAATLLQVPVTNLTPGDVQVRPKIKVPLLSDPKSAQRGMKYFANFNCVGCHMGNGGGGMGPALSNHAFIYGGEPENIYLSIYQGRPHGMPAWGTVLPNDVIWDLVAYIKNLSSAPSSEWGSTTSGSSPSLEQVPLELNASDTPWQHTEKFSDGQRP
jgi:cytochrome c oxidase cbb3-type subunit III